MVADKMLEDGSSKLETLGILTLSAVSVLWLGVLLSLAVSAPILVLVIAVFVGAGALVGWFLRMRPGDILGMLICGDALMLFTLPFLVAGGRVFAVASTLHFLGLALASTATTLATRRIVQRRAVMR